MGVRFRKSLNLGGGFRVNLSKSGVGYSWGTKGARFTKTAKGTQRTTLSVPGTGLSYVQETSNRKKTQSNNRTEPILEPQNPKLPNNNQQNEGKKNMKKGGKKYKKILLWFLTVFFAFAAMAYLPKLSGFMALAFVLLVLPIEKWQNIVRSKIRGKLKPLIATALAVLCLVSAPTTESTNPEQADTTGITRELPTVVSDEQINATEEEPTTDVVTPVIELATVPSVSEETIEPTEEASTEPSSEPMTEPPTEAATEPPTTAATEPPTTEAPTEDKGWDYVINTNTGKFHYTSCSSVSDIKPSNRRDFHGTRDDLVARGYSPCGRCHP